MDTTYYLPCIRIFFKCHISGFISRLGLQFATIKTEYRESMQERTSPNYDNLTVSRFTHLKKLSVRRSSVAESGKKIVGSTLHDRLYSPCSFGLWATSQQYFSLRTNQPPATSQLYFFLRTNKARVISHELNEQALNETHQFTHPYTATV
jgi:hypothetical protein